MNDVLGHDSALLRIYWLETTWANEMNFVMNHATVARSIDLLASSPAGYLCTTDASTQDNNGIT